MPSKFMVWDTVLAALLVLIFRFVFHTNSIDLGFFVIVWFMVGGFADTSMRIDELTERIGTLSKEMEQIKAERAS